MTASTVLVSSPVIASVHTGRGVNWGRGLLVTASTVLVSSPVIANCSEEWELIVGKELVHKGGI